MDDAYGDPRNYDPNEDDPYGLAPPSGSPPQTNLPPRGAPVAWGAPNPPQNVPGGWSDERTGGFIPGSGGNAAGYQDLSYWASRGVPADQIVDFQSGQIRPGWSRTGRGYEQGGGGSPPPTQPSPGPSPTGGDYHLPSGRQGGDPYAMLSGQPTSSTLPYPSYQSAPQLQYDPYMASSWEDAENEPGYKASRTNLRKQIEAGAAYRGMVRSGMTIGDLYSNLDALGQQNFKGFDDRRFRNWSGNFGLAQAKHAGAVTDIDRANNYRFNTADASFKDALDRWKTQVGSLTQLARPVD